MKSCLPASGWPVAPAPVAAVVADEPRPFPGTEIRWDGLVRHDFGVDGSGAIVVEPESPRPGRPRLSRGAKP